MEISRYLSLAYPQALALGALLVFAYLRWARVRNLWRAVLVGLAVVLLVYPSLVHRSRALDVYVLVDRSRSISEAGRAKQREMMDLVQRGLEEGDRLGVVSFNEKAHLEQSASAQAVPAEFTNPYSPDGSDLAEGLELVLSQLEPGRSSRVLILSDGEYTGPSPLALGRMAAQSSVPLYYRHLARLELFNLAVRDAQMPDKVTEGEPFRLSFDVQASQAAAGRYRLLRNGRVLGGEQDGGWRAYDFAQGNNRLSFSDQAAQAGVCEYRLEVETAADGPQEAMRADNSARRFVQVIGQRPLLLVNQTGQPDNCSRILSAAGLEHHVVAVGSMRLGMEQLTGYQGVILNNVPVLGLSNDQLRALRQLVEQEGAGLMVTGGGRSFAAGGYYRTSLEGILPVSLEDRQNTRKVSTAFSIALDRSGSMQMTTPSGHKKIELATQASAECVELLSAVDSLSVIAVDSSAHVVVPQQPVENPGSIMRNIRRIESMGGGIFTYTALAAAGNELLRASQLNKHILLFADAADAEEPGDYVNLLEDYRKTGVTVSVVALGTEADPDAEFLRDVAKRGGGSIYFTQDAAQLVQFFTADTLSYTRNNYIEDPVAVSVQAGAFALAPGQSWSDFSCGGYNLLFARPRAQVALMTGDQDRAPVLAFWQAGLGRVVALALNAEQDFSGLPQYGDIMISGVRWMIGSQVSDTMQVKVDYEGSLARLGMELSADELAAFGTATAFVFAPDGRTIERPLVWTRHDRLGVDFKLGQEGCYRGVIKMGDQLYRIGPMSIPVSPEFMDDRPADFGRKTLAELARLSEAKEALDVRELFEGRRGVASLQPIVWPLLWVMLVLMLLEIAEPRFGLLGLLRRAWLATAGAARSWAGKVRTAGQSRAARASDSLQTPSSSVSSPPSPQGAAAPAPAAQTKAPSAPDSSAPLAEPKAASPPAASAADMDYLSRSKRQARRRM